ncbi:rod shape-determining protein RodA [Leadbetterella byssophila DSM 17132]|uniref:Cell wall polymerase n=1 Tax=Leadbetterella byssophila (strain DSM 17132 / JCM 16389 / KACC 11308 / NBRC 106382 / 4M15) TaxID=649349 RepID=E4RUA7_LEAB4|nr:rod shape-determining protein RodA [Leadbetterella byssophila]ADQ16941.1 rod shape-determining protein RodA [Leadbetterella byssophila DSM 17132]
MAREIDIKKGLDWTTVWIYIILLGIGLINIYAAVYNVDNPKPIYSLDHNAGKQILFMGLAFFIIMVILFVDYKVYDTFAYLFYGFWILVLVLTIFIAPDIKGSRSWLRFGGFQFQPAELAKTITLLALARYLSTQGISVTKFKDLLRACVLIFLPPLIIILQKETGSALAFGAFIIILYREGLPGVYPALILAFIALFILGLVFEGQIWIVLLGLALVAVLFWYLFLKRYERNRQNLQRVIGLFILFSGFVMAIDFALNNVFAPHQQKRIMVLVNPDVDPLGAGWNISQSKLAIGSGGLFGKGWLQGTQTKFDFVPEQSTDFIFCTVGEEWGFVGVFVVIALYFILITRIFNLAEKQKFKFARIYGYGVGSILFFHLLVNIGMTIGLIPIIGIPLPFLSYGGSSLLSFTILLFIFLKLDAHRSYKV